MKMFNTLSRKKEVFKPIKKGSIGMYVCGPTVQGPMHIGHARTYIAFDIIRRYLEFRGFKVKFVMNITDIHDSIIEKTSELGMPFEELIEKYIKIFFESMHALGLKPATANPQVTKHIPEIIAFVQDLQKKGFAYETDDGVYFKISKFKDYGKLSGIKFEKGKTGTRVDTDKYEKTNAQDFALWKKQKPEEPFWESPWKKGRPGWHIECSAMSSKYLGEQFDIHGGGNDLVFPHHENEIAQSEAYSGKKPFVKYWLHTGFLNVEGQKMSKSLNNFIEVPDLLKTVDAKTFRFFIAQLHYKTAINFSKAGIEAEKAKLDSWNEFIQRLLDCNGKKENKKIRALTAKAFKDFEKEMDNDFAAPNAWAALYKFQSKVNRLLAKKQLGKKNALQIMAFLKKIDSIFGVFDFEKKEFEISKENLELIREREGLRKQKKFAEADEIRKKLLEKGILLDDTEQGTKWKKIK